eukprot:Skav211158  [mRNA]  locus=scaffold413:446265:446627:+ [translate_table: standard]
MVTVANRQFCSRELRRKLPRVPNWLRVSSQCFGSLPRPHHLFLPSLSRRAMAREFRLMNGESVSGQGLEEEMLKVRLAKEIIAQELKLQAQQVVLFDASGLLQDGDQIPIDCLIQIYIQD